MPSQAGNDTMQNDAPKAGRELSGDGLLLVVSALALAFVLFGFAVSGPADVFRGLGRILMARDTLITDYIGLGGMGAAFVNAGLLTLVVAAIYRFSGATIGGGAVACLLLVLGFALFGKNLVNIWPIVLGVWLYARFKREKFAQHINTAFFGCALAPVVSEILFSSALQVPVAIPLALATGLAMGGLFSIVGGTMGVDNVQASVILASGVAVTGQ